MGQQLKIKLLKLRSRYFLEKIDAYITWDYRSNSATFGHDSLQDRNDHESPGPIQQLNLWKHDICY